MSAPLETVRLLLRPLTADDAERLFELDADPEVMRHVGPYQLADAEAYRQRIRDVYLPYDDRPGGIGFRAAIEKASGDFLGWIVLRPALDYRFAAQAEFQSDDLELGYRLRRAAWGKGYATEASRALVRLAFAEPGAARVVACALVANVASTRVMEKVGLKWLGTFAVPDFEQPAVKYALARAEFERTGRTS